MNPFKNEILFLDLVENTLIIIYAYVLKSIFTPGPRKGRQRGSRTEHHDENTLVNIPTMCYIPEI